jgi:hypothetical protein
MAGVLENGYGTEPQKPEESPVPEESEETAEDDKVPEIPGLNEPKKDNLMYDLEDAVNDPIFHPDGD